MHMHILDRNQTPPHAQTFKRRSYRERVNAIAPQYLLNSQASCWGKKAISATLIVQTIALCCPGVTCSICWLRGGVDTRSPHWWRSGDGKIISVAEGKVSSPPEISRQTRWASTPKQCWSKHVNIWSSESPGFGTKISIYIFQRLQVKISRRCT